MIDAAMNIPGVDVVEVKQLNAENLAPGAKAGRLTIWSQAAIESLSKNKLFA
jgi:large subunit ribosomal protein L4e